MVLTRGAFDQSREPERHTIGFESGVPCSLDREPMSPVALIEHLESMAAPFGIGRGIHLGDTIIGFKGRVAFEAPAAEVLLAAHRELEKLVLSARQARIKDQLAATYGDLVHEGQHLDPVCRDIEAAFLASQRRVTGEVNVLLRSGAAFVEGVESPFSLMKARKAPMANQPANGRRPRRMAIRRCWRCRASSTRARASGENFGSRAMKNVVVDKIASIAQAAGLGHELRRDQRHPLRGRSAAGRRDPDEQVDLQHNSSSRAAAWRSSHAAT